MLKKSLIILAIAAAQILPAAAFLGSTVPGIGVAEAKGKKVAQRRNKNRKKPPIRQSNQKSGNEKKSAQPRRS